MPLISFIHAFAGLTIFSGSFVQIALGSINSLFIYILPIKNDFIHKFKLIHKFVGIFLTIISYGNLILGFIVLNKDDLL